MTIQWLGLCESNAGGLGSIHGQRTKIPQTMQYSQNFFKRQFFLRDGQIHKMLAFLWWNVGRWCLRKGFPAQVGGTLWSPRCSLLVPWNILFLEQNSKETDGLTLWTLIRVLRRFSGVRLFVTLWTVASQAPLSMGILQARILESVAMASSRTSSRPRDQTRVSYVSCVGRQVLYH